MRGTEGNPIWKVSVQEGQPVSVVEQLILLEFIIMEIPNVTEESSVAKKVCLAKGDFVNVDDALVEVE